MILFRKNPLTVVMSSFRSRKSRTCGLRKVASVNPAIQPVAIRGCRVASGAERAEARIVRGCASRRMAPAVAQDAVISDQDQIMFMLV